jgi:predicted nuclease of predicted toxin-antitoxin system
VLWLADENINRAIVQELRNAGHDVVYAAEEARQTSDRVLLDRAFAEGRVLLTEDKDFGEIVFREGRHAAGVVLIRVGQRNWSYKWTQLVATILVRGDLLYGHFTTVDASGPRAQPLVQG